MKIVSALFLLLFSISVQAKTPVTTEVLALKLWNVLEKTQNTSYSFLDTHRLRVDKDSPAGKLLANPEHFKRIQTMLRNTFVDRVSKEFSRKEIINLTTIYQRPEVEKLRLFRIDFWDDKLITELIDRDLLSNTIK